MTYPTDPATCALDYIRARATMHERETMRRNNPLKKQMEDQRQRWMRTFEAECMRLKPDWADPRNRPQDFWDSATYYYNESYTPFAAAQGKCGLVMFLGTFEGERWVCNKCDRVHNFEPERCMTCASTDVVRVD